MPDPAEDYGLRAAIWSVALSGAGLTVASAFVLGRGSVLGVGFGAAIACVNLWALARIVRAFINGAGLPWVLFAAFKLVALLAVVALVLHFELTTVIPLAVGYGALPIGIVLAQLSPTAGASRAGAGRAASREATSPSYEGEVEDDARRKG